MSEIEMFQNDKSPEAAVSSPVTTQATTAPQDPPSEPAAAPRGHRPSRAAAHPPRRRPTPSRSPSRRQPLFFTPPPKAAVRATSGRSAPYSRPGQSTTASRTGSRSSCPAKRPSASLGRALDTEAASPPPPPCSSEHQLAGDVRDRQAVASPSHRISTSTPSAEKTHPQLIPHLTPNPLPYPWPAAPPSHPSASMPPLPA
ncbi:hypothetical protein QQF64_018081 [Cirrhinus molitorella]|uniref:Uncharacterized protein n=1 Tax=Cirrhinus molitorella TaxID=172907 RepID=A0ABR3LKH3_9TELE